MNNLTLAIITYKRPKKLKRCLTSILEQTVLPKKVLIIDNDKRQTAKGIFKLFKNKFPIEYAVEKRQGIPNARNKALKLCKTPLLGFIDDDCVLDKNWVKVALQSAKDTRASYILGKSLLFNKNSIIAFAQHCRQTYWFFRDLEKNNNLPSPFNLDTKNVVFKIRFLKKNNIWFDQDLFIHTVGGHADTDLGFQFKNKGLIGRYEPKMIVYHEEVQRLRDFFKKAYHRGRVGVLLYKKWNLKKELIFLPDIYLYKWLKRMKCWPDDYKKWTKNIEKNFFIKVVVFLLIKFYDKVYLQGFVDQSKREKINLAFFYKTYRDL